MQINSDIFVHLAIIVTNTDLSDFAHKHPLDGEKFTTMVHSVRPKWRCSIFLAHKNEFPKNPQSFDGIIITGSPASVHDDDPWIKTLLSFIQIAYKNRIPIYGACYGHQAIAMALGGNVEPNPQGWIFGLVKSEIITKKPWMYALENTHTQFAAHIEQVTELPTGAETITQTLGVPNCGFVISNLIYTSQNHPEMTREFFVALLDEYQDKLGGTVTKTAISSLELQENNEAYAETVAAFFELKRL